MDKTQRRFVVKTIGEGRAQRFGVYDRARGSFPIDTPETGKVAQRHTTAEAAQAEADRLEERR